MSRPMTSEPTTGRTSISIPPSYEIAGNENLLAIYEGICKRMSLFRQASLSLPGQLSVSLQKHRKIAEAITSNDPAKAGNLLRHHTLEAKKTLLRAIMDKKAS